FNRFNRDGKAETLAEGDLHIGNAYDFAGHVEQRTAAVPRVDLCRRLQIKFAAKLPSLGAEDAFGYGALEAQRAADREHALTNRQSVRAAHKHVFEFGRVLVIDLEQS